jgi:hypothetical protein
MYENKFVSHFPSFITESIFTRNGSAKHFNVTKKERIIISIGAFVGGLILCGFAMTTTLGQLISTLCLEASIRRRRSILTLRTSNEKNENDLPFKTSDILNFV